MLNKSALKCFPKLTAPPLGYVECTSLNNYNSVCTFSCDTVHANLLVERERLVLSDPGRKHVRCISVDGNEKWFGKWNSSPPTCECE